MKVKDLVWKEIITVKPDISVSEAIDLMLKKGIRALLVEPKDRDECYGIITVRDIVYRVIARDLKPSDVKVSEIATKPIVTIDCNCSIKTAAKLMASLNLARLLVTECGKPIGLITLMDVMKAARIEE